MRPLFSDFCHTFRSDISMSKCRVCYCSVHTSQCVDLSRMSIIDGDTNRLNFDGERTKPHSVYVFEWTATAKSSNSLSSSDAVVLETAKLPTVLSLEIDKETSEYLTDALTLSMTTVVTAAADYAFYYQRGESERVLRTISN